MIHPEVILADQVKDKAGLLGLYPVYPAIQGISRHVLTSTIRGALDQYGDTLEDPIPSDIIRRLGLPDLVTSVRGVHIPPKGASLELLNLEKTDHHRRLVFDRFFRLMLNIALRKVRRKSREGFVCSTPNDVMARVERCFPFTLTHDQRKAVKEIVRDFKSGRPMNRLLQGDVGCGKTAISVAAAYVAILNRWQVALMAPTQILALQHYRYFLDLSENMGFRPVLVTGALSKSDRLKIYEKIKKGEHDVIIGTHSLIEKGLSFAKLGLVVIDEEHRFGVRQRALLDEKGANSHLLVMTATPIPRTLAMTVYADLEISMIREYPGGRRPVLTRLMDESRKRDVYNVLIHRLSMGQQALVVCPVIEGSEERDLKNAMEMHGRLEKILSPRFSIGLIHGRLSADEKARVMDPFRKGKIDLLVGTTVIEVGVHAPGATVMVIEHPERFGLAQLHQLRGRIGRGTTRGLCFLMIGKGISEDALSRLKILVETNDGFEIAQKDLEMRGQGELMGVRQAGVGELDFREMMREPELLVSAKREAEQILASDPDLLNPENRLLKVIAYSMSSGVLDISGSAFNDQRAPMKDE
jgi:ATP-dependent DNA helicase RecG